MLRCGHCAKNFAVTDTGFIEKTVHELAYHASD